MTHLPARLSATCLVTVFVMSSFAGGPPAPTSRPATAPAAAADNTLTDAERRDGWELLFDGRTADGWRIGGRAVPAANVHDGCLNPHDAGEGRKDYVVYTTRTFGDFVLTCDFKIAPDCNSGVFVRVGDVADPVQTGLEVQILDTAGKANPDRNDGGALYDALAPSANAMRPAGEWNHVEITARGGALRVVLNGRQVIDADLDRWTAAGKNPDGSANKYKRPLKDFPRVGHVGLQDHHHDVWFKNIKVKPAPERP